MQPPQLEFVAHVSAEIGTPVTSGQSPRGRRQMIPITGGNVTGPRLAGRVLPGGADFQLIRSDGVCELEARYFIETDAGARVYIENHGVAHAAGGQGLYFRTTPRFETSDESLRWLMLSVFVATAAPGTGRVDLDFFRVL